MRTLLQTKVSVRGQAIIILALVAFWYVSIAGSIYEIGARQWFWAALFFMLPFAIAAFTAILIVSRRRSALPHQWWFRAAMAAAISCWALVALYLGFTGLL